MVQKYKKGGKEKNVFRFFVLQQAEKL